MIKLLPALKPRERRLALVAGALFSCWMLVIWGVDPLWHRVGDLRQQIDRQTNLARELKSLLDEGPGVESHYQQLGRFFESPGADAGRSLLLDELEGLARTAGVQMNLKPLAPKQEQKFTRLPVEVDAEGGQAELLEFLDAVFRLPRLITVDRLRLSATPGKEERLRANLVIQQLVVTSPAS